MIWLHPITIFCLSIVLTSCVSTRPPQPGAEAISQEMEIQHALELASLLAYQQRLDRIAYPILNKADDFCGSEVTTSIGLRVASQHSFRKALRQAAQSEQQLGDRLQVLWVIENSAAEHHSIVAGDQIVAINEQPIAEGRRGLKQYRRALKSALGSDQPVSVSVLRGDTRHTFPLPAERICNYPARVSLSPVANAFADGATITVQSGLLNLFSDDRDVAFIVSHELAHNIKNHPLKGTASGLFRLTVDVILGATGINKLTSIKLLPALEAEADYVGLYIAAKAGVDISEADQVWRTFAAETSRAKQRKLIDTHPPTPERYVALRETIKEIEAKRAAGLPLTPNR